MNLIIGKRASRRAFAVLICLVLSLCTACGSERSDRPELLEPVNAKLETSLVERMDLSDLQLYDGRIMPGILEMSFDMDGYLYRTFVSAGDTVEEGEVLAAIVGENFNRINSLQDELKALEESDAEKFTYLEAELELARLVGDDTAELELKVKHEKELAELKRNEKQQMLDRLLADDIGYVYITAPMDGTVMAVSTVRAGGFISAGAPVVAIDLGEGKTLTCGYISEIEIRDSYDYYALIHGERYELEYIPYSKEELRILALHSITPVAKFNFKGETEGVSVGDYAMVVRTADTKQNVLVVPSSAVYSDATGKFVYEVVDNVRIKREVVTGISDGAYTEITDGIEEGASVYVKN